MVRSNMRAVQFTRTAIHATGPWQLQSAQWRPPDAVLSRGLSLGSMRFLEHGRSSVGAGNSTHSFCPSYCSVGRIHRSGLNRKVLKPTSCDGVSRNASQDYIGEKSAFSGLHQQNSVSDSRTFVQLPRYCDDNCTCRHPMVRKGHQCSHTDSPLHMLPSSPKSPGSTVSCQQMCRNNPSSKIKSVQNRESDCFNPEVSAKNIRKHHFSSDSCSVFSDRKKYGGISLGTRYTINMAENSAINPYINEFHPSLSSTGRCNYVQRRHQSSLPLSGSSGVTADDKQQDWTTLGAREYGKSIRVLREPVTVTTAQIKQHLTSCNVRFEQGHTCFVTTCPRLKKKLPVEEMEKLYINMTTGWFVCHSCQKAGSWTQLQDNLAMLKGARRRKDQCCLPELEVDYNVSTSPQMSALWQSSLPLSDTDEALESFLHSTGLQNLSVKTLQTYGVRLDKSQDSISLLVPIYFVEKKLHAVKRVFVKSTEDGTPKALRETVLPRGEVSGVVGWQTVATDTTEVVLTASEFDAMAVYQSTRLPAIALPKGDSTLPQEILPMLEQFKKIVLWFKNDIRSWEIAKQFTKKLSQKRCFVIRPSEDQPSALEALQRGVDLSKILSQARSVSHQSITAFSQLRHEVFSELAHVEQVAGVKWKRYPQLNRLLKGHRRGELTIFTGPTGSGKTTFISDYSLDLCMQGVNTLWGSFEINNVRLMKMMLTQFAQQNLTKHLTTFDHWADQFESLPMYFMTFFGQESIKKVIETMSHAVYVHDIAHVVVDNLQFMMGVENDRQPMDRFQRQDLIVAAFRKFATTMNCHVTVVVHPRKEKETEELTTASVYGSAKATQEADNVMILQDKRLLSVRGKKYLQISKNRFDGELGVMLLKFDKESLSFAIKQQKSKDEKTPVEDAEGLAEGQTGKQINTHTGLSPVED